MHGYARTVTLHKDDSAVARIMLGGSQKYANVTGSSDDTGLVVAAVRELWPAPAHRVTRADTSVDFDDGAGTFDRLAALCLAHADAASIKVDHMGDWHRAMDGRTLYLGSRKSAVMVRVYEKGIQLQQRNPGFEGLFSRNLVRVEVQVRPEKASRLQAAACDPLELFGFGKWTIALIEELLDVTDVEYVRIRERRESDRDRALRWMVRQYGDHLASLADDTGLDTDPERWAMAGMMLRDLLARA